MNAPEHRYQVNQLTPDPAVTFDRAFAAQYVLYAHRLAERGYVQAAVGNRVVVGAQGIRSAQPRCFERLVDQRTESVLSAEADQPS